MEQDLGRLQGSELTTVLLGEMRRRAAMVTPARVLRRSAEDRFSRIGEVDPAAVRRVQSVLAEHLPPGTVELELSPVAPLGTHAAVAGVDQHRVVATVRGSELAADPTVVLALEAARRRSALIAGDPKNADLVSMASFQRVTRAQMFEGTMSYAHFQLSGLVTAGRDTGNRGFEHRAIAMHVRSIAAGITALGCDGVEIRFSDLTGGELAGVVDALRTVEQGTGVAIVAFPERTRARQYYTDCAIEVHAAIGGTWFEVGDGGTVDWTARLVQSSKERAMTSGLGVERLALLLG